MNKNISILIIFIIALLMSCSKARKLEFSSNAYILYNVNIINVENGEILKNKAIVIDSGRIKSIGDYDDLKSFIPKNDHNNLNNRFIIPGLWDMHSHIDKLSDDFEHSKLMLSLYTLNGVTSIREMGGDWNKLKKLKQASENNYLLPTVLTAGPILENKAFVDWVAKVDNDPEFKKQRVGISSVGEVEHKVDSVLQLGVDFIKVRTAASKEMFFEIAKQCKKHKVKFCGHVDAKVDLYNAVASGISSLEHLDIFQLTGMSDVKMDSVVNLMKEKGTAYCPTLTYFKKHRIYETAEMKAFLNDTIGQFPLRSYVSKRLLAKSKQAMQGAANSQVPWKEMEANFLKFATKILSSDVMILAGTDGANALVLPGFGLQEELELYSSELNMTPLQILQTATINPSKYFGFENKLGLIKEGYDADLVILDKNPLLNIKDIAAVNSVVKSGTFISNEEIKEKLEAIKNTNENDE